jgi:uncharacterized repeat protein (TIGR03803 family)
MQRLQGLAAITAATALSAWGGPPAAAASFSTIYSFVNAQGGAGDANNPYAGLIMDGAGALYGTSYAGGAAGEGAVYRLSPPTGDQPSWTETILYSFYAGNRTDGVHPTSRLVFGQRGTLYGTTSAAGGTGAGGRGTVFELAPPATAGGAWTETTLHVFGAAGDGATPYAGLAIDAAGTLYGTTSAGGSSAGKDLSGFGTVFSLSPPANGAVGWTETILHSFTDSDGIAPQTDLLLGPNATLFGTTPNCGAKLACSGTVFEIALAAQGGPAERILYKFPASGANGQGPSSGLTMDAGGALYGATSLGIGAVYRLAPQDSDATMWKQTVLARFPFDKAGGPEGGVLIGPGGVLYGTLAYGAHQALGTVYKLAPPAGGSGPWPQTVLYAISPKPKGGGVDPVGDLVADRNGAFYGVTEIGGVGGVGTVFKVTP